MAAPQAVARLPVLSELFADSTLEASAVGLVMALLPPGARPILWVQDRASARDTGLPYLADGIQRVSVGRAADALQAMEDGLGCRALGGVVGEVWGAPPALGFVATTSL